MQLSFDTLALLGVCAVLGVAFYSQFGRGELPCPLCALQRVGFIVAGVALVLNLRAGYSPAHYGLPLLSAVAPGSASLRQISCTWSRGPGTTARPCSAITSTRWRSPDTVRWSRTPARC